MPGCLWLQQHTRLLNKRTSTAFKPQIGEVTPFMCDPFYVLCPAACPVSPVSWCVRLAPPLVLTDEQCLEAADIIRKTIMSYDN